jgi:hypothetical protein
MSGRGQRDGRGGQGGQARGGRQQANKEYHQKRGTAQQTAPATKSATLEAAQPAMEKQKAHTQGANQPILTGKRALPIALASSSSALSALSSSDKKGSEVSSMIQHPTSDPLETTIIVSTETVLVSTVNIEYNEEEEMKEVQKEPEGREVEIAYEDLEDEGMGILDVEDSENQVLWRSDSIAVFSEVENFGERLLEIKDSLGEIFQVIYTSILDYLCTVFFNREVYRKHQATIRSKRSEF